MGSACSSQTKDINHTAESFPSQNNHSSSTVISPVPSKQLPGKMTERRKLRPRTVSVINLESEDLIKLQNPELVNETNGFDKKVTEMKAVNKKNFRDKENLGEEYLKMYKIVHEVTELFHNRNEHSIRLFLGRYLAKTEFVEEIVKYYTKVIEVNEIEAYTHEYIPGDDEMEDDEDFLDHLMMEIRTLLWNYADDCPEFGQKVTKTIMFQHLVNDLRGLKADEREINTVSYDSPDSFAFNSTLGIINNCAKGAVRRDVFTITMPNEPTKVTMVECLTPFVKMNNTYVKLVTLLALSHIVNEQESGLLLADVRIFDFLIEMITKATEAKDRRHLGFSVHELIDGLANLAKNDKNKTLLMDRNVYPVLNSILRKGSIPEQTAVVKALWELSFIKKNREEFKNDKKLWKLLNDLKKSEDPELKKAADGACFVIDQKDEPVRETPGAPVSQARDGHVMISYNWADQKILVQVKDWLVRDGFKVWIDIENMEGSLLESMARAIENASVVLMCYSEKYKDSQNCRTEAEYTYKLKKNTIPLVMQSGYSPDGWLGILIGSKLYYDFSGKYPIESKYLELKRALQGNNPISEEAEEGMPTAKPRPKRALPAPSQPAAAVVPSPRPISVAVTDASQWSKADIARWLTDNRLEAFSGLKNLSGEQIAFLYKLFHRAPEFFYRCIQEKLGMKSLDELMRFSDAVEKLG